MLNANQRKRKFLNKSLIERLYLSTNWVRHQVQFVNSRFSGQSLGGHLNRIIDEERLLVLH